MSFAKIFKAPIKLFKKDVITFVLIKRYDLGVLDKKLHYIAVKPFASLTVLRQKIWFLLDLPDYCDEIILLKSSDNVEIPLTELRKGNDPEHPYFLEVWPAGKKSYTYSSRNNLLTIGNGEITMQNSTGTDTILEEERQHDDKFTGNMTRPIITQETTPMDGFRIVDSQQMNKLNLNYEKSDLSCKISSSSFFTLNRRKSHYNCINVLLKIQSDLSTLSNKLSNLETRIPI